MTDTIATFATAGSLAELQTRGPTAHARSATLPVVVFWHDGRGVRDRGPLPASRLPAAPGHGRGRARDVPLAPRTLRPRVGLHARPVGRRRARLRRRARAATTCSCAPASDADPDRAPAERACATGSRRDISLVIAKSVLGLLEAGVRAGGDRAHRRRVRHARYRAQGWGAGLTVLVAMANLLPHLDADDHALALVHGLAFVARDTREPRAALRGRGARDRGRADRTPRRLVPAVRRHPVVRRRRTHARDRARRARHGSPTSRR